jgi:endonuclease-3
MVDKNKCNLDLDSLISELHFLRQSLPKTLTESIKINHPNNVYLILIGCLLSLRARDVVTWPTAEKFFKTVTSPEHMVSLAVSEIEIAIQSINFYRRKAKVLHQVSIDLIEKYGGQVPRTVEELLSLPGVGIKTANLVLAEGFGIPAICVDTHVHRLSNRWGLVKTQTAEQTEKQLRLVLPEKYWIDWNRLLVVIGQNICTARCKGCNICTYFD